MQGANESADTGKAGVLIDLLDRYQGLSAIRSPTSNHTAREIEAYTIVKAHLTHLGQQLAQNADQRPNFAHTGSFSALVDFLPTLYTAFEQAQSTRPTSSHDEEQAAPGAASSADIKEQHPDPYYRISHIATLCFRLLRNGMAGCSDAQAHLASHFDLVAPFLANLTRFHTLNDPDTLLLCRAAVQMLSNLITANDEVQRIMWTRIVTTNRDQDKLVLKFLSSPDTATQSTAQVLLINFLRSPSGSAEHHERLSQLCTHPSGLQLIETLLSSSDSIMLRTTSASQDEAAEEYEPESEIQGLEESLGFIYTIFSILFESGYASSLVSALAPMEEISSTSSPSMVADKPIISSSQLTLLKLLDSWLHHSQKQVAETSAGPAFALDASSRESALKGAGLIGLVDIFIQLSAFARGAMSSGMAKDGASPDKQPQDRRLFGVHRGLLLVLECLLSISMTADGWSDERSLRQGDAAFAHLSRALLWDMRRNTAFVDELVELLDQTHQYAPALSPFRPTGANSGADTATETRPLPKGHALSSTGEAAQAPNGTQPSYGFDHLKRDTVRVLGSLVYAPTHGNGSAEEPGSDEAKDMRQVTKSQIRQVQDRVREKGGLFHVLNMTVLDERNPYMREHAIFTLRYLLAGNVASQSLVSSLQPAQPDDGRGGVQLPMV